MNTRVPRVSGEAQEKERRTRSRVTATSLVLLSSAGGLHRALHVVFRIKPNSSPQTRPVQPHSYTLHSCQSSLSYTHTLRLSLPPTLPRLRPNPLGFPKSFALPPCPPPQCLCTCCPLCLAYPTLPSPLKQPSTHRSDLISSLSATGRLPRLGPPSHPLYTLLRATPLGGSH